jgi:rubrerythrin
MVNKNTAMDDVQEKLRVLLDYWIEHNSEHEQEFRDWADKVAPSYTEVANQLQKAAIKMASVSDELMKAKQALPKSKGRH